jgi:carbonic anhydrase
MDWNFSNYYLWRNSFPECSGKEQSPINIDTSPEVLEECSIMCQLNMRYKKSDCRVNLSPQNVITVEMSTGSYAKYNDTPYELSKMYIHTPSMHTIDGEQFDAEIMMVHSTGSDNAGSSNGLIVCRLLNRQGNDYGPVQEFFNEFIFKIPRKPIDYFVDVPVSNEWSAEKLLPEKNTSFFMYDGSLPFPPCSEKYKVFVFEEIGNIGATNLELLRENIGDNSRPTQPLSGRKIFYNAGREIGRTPTRRELTNNDKFLKCVEDDMPRKKVELVKKKRDKFIDEKMADNTAKIIKLVFMCLTFVFLLILAYLTVLYMYRGYYTQKLIMVMLPEHLKDDAITRTWETCSATVGAKVFNDIQFKKTIVKNKTRIRKIKSDIASGKFIRDDPTGMKEKTANRELKTLEDGIKNARLGLDDKTPDGRPLYNEQGDVVSTKFSKEDLKTFSPMMY